MAKCKKCGSPVCMCGSPNHFVDPTMAAAGIQPDMTYQVPMQANQMGTAKPVFSPQTQGMAQTIYGTPDQRQQSVATPFQANAFYASLDAAKKEGRDTFKVGDKTFEVK